LGLLLHVWPVGQVNDNGMTKNSDAGLLMSGREIFLFGDCCENFVTFALNKL